MRECHHVVRGRWRGHIALHSHTRTTQLDRRPQCPAQTEALNQSGDSIGDPRDVTAPRWPARRRGSGSLCLPDHREVIIGRTHPSLSLSRGTLINFLPLLVTPVRGENTILINGLDDEDVDVPTVKRAEEFAMRPVPGFRSTFRFICPVKRLTFQQRLVHI